MCTPPTDGIGSNTLVHSDTFDGSAFACKFASTWAEIDEFVKVELLLPKFVEMFVEFNPEFDEFNPEFIEFGPVEENNDDVVGCNPIGVDGVGNVELKLFDGLPIVVELEEIALWTEFDDEFWVKLFFPLDAVTTFSNSSNALISYSSSKSSSRTTKGRVDVEGAEVKDVLFCVEGDGIDVGALQILDALLFAEEVVESIEEDEFKGLEGGIDALVEVTGGSISMNSASSRYSKSSRWLLKSRCWCWFELDFPRDGSLVVGLEELSKKFLVFDPVAFDEETLPAEVVDECSENLES